MFVFIEFLIKQNELGGLTLEKLEIKKVTPGSAFKVTLYFAIIPVLIMILIGIIALIVGLATGESAAAIFGGVYIIMPVVMVIIYGAFGALFALLYNVLSKKFGGLEIYVNQLNDNE